MLFKFACDESYDSPKEPPYDPKTYIVGGFFSEEKIWTRVERRWKNANERYGVPRFHASHLNAKSWEYDGWSDPQKIRYGKQMVRILTDQGKKMHAVSCGLLVDEYREIINEQGRRNFGHPYLVCFKTCLAIIAREMESFDKDDQFAVILDRNPMEAEAVKLFYDLKGDLGFRYRSRLATCTPASNDDVIALQPADFVAYESFRLLHSKRYGEVKYRKALRATFPANGFLGYYLGRETLASIKEPLELAVCRQNGFVLMPPALVDNLEYAKRHNISI